jgi:HD-GYP domain-containing protein (c-di-GMP phosphodiesterase class II)
MRLREYAQRQALPYAQVGRRGGEGAMSDTIGAQGGTRAAMGRLLAMMQAHHPATAAHMRRVGDLAAQLGDALGLGEGAIDRLRWGGRLHDIGKLAICPATLDRLGPLSPLEEHQLDRCPAVGAQIAQLCLADPAVLPIIRLHRERLDGSGVPHGLLGTEIPLLARVVVVADAFDAMTSPRPYQLLRAPQAALAELAAGAGRLWDAEVGIDPSHRTTPFLGFVRHERRDLRERPAMDAAAGFGLLADLRPLADVLQVLKHNRCARSETSAG